MSVSGLSEAVGGWRKPGRMDARRSILKECDERVEVAVDVEDADGLLVDPECAPLRSRGTPRTCRSAGKRKEGRRLHRRRRLSVMLPETTWSSVSP